MLQTSQRPPLIIPPPSRPSQIRPKPVAQTNTRQPPIVANWLRYLGLALIAGIVGAALAGGIVWRLGATAIAMVALPSGADIEGLNFGRGRDNLAPFTRQDVFAVYTQTLSQVGNQRAFFDTQVLPSLSPPLTEQQEAAAFSAFRSKLQVTPPDRTGSITVRYRAPTLQEARDTLSLYLGFTDQAAKQLLFAQARTQLRNAMELQRLALGRDDAFARETIRTELAEAKRALAIAHAIKLEHEPRDDTSAKDASGLSGTLRYRRGQAALSAEIDTLTRMLASPNAIRTANTASLKDATLFYQTAHEMLETAHIKPSLLDTITASDKRNALAPLAILGGLAGVILGIYAAYLFHSRRKVAGGQYSPEPAH